MLCLQPLCSALSPCALNLVFVLCSEPMCSQVTPCALDHLSLLHLRRWLRAWQEFPARHYSLVPVAQQPLQGFQHMLRNMCWTRACAAMVLPAPGHALRRVWRACQQLSLSVTPVSEGSVAATGIAAPANLGLFPLWPPPTFGATARGLGSIHMCAAAVQHRSPSQLTDLCVQC